MLIVAHRGGRWPEAPENTLAAFAAAVAAGADSVEVDVLPSRDGELVVHHDDSLLRMTGVDRCVWEADWRDIAALRVGGGRERVPTLLEVAGALPSGVRLALDFKYGDERFPGLADRIAAFARAFGAERVTVMSIVHPFVEAVAAKAPGIRGLLTLRVPPATREDVIALAAHVPQGLGISASMTACSAAVMAVARVRRGPVYLWAPDSPVELAVAAALPIDAIITDNVTAALAVCSAGRKTRARRN